MTKEVRYKLLIIVGEGEPRWITLNEWMGRSAAVKAGQKYIVAGHAKAVVVYRGKKPTQLLVYRPTTYVHLERI